MVCALPGREGDKVTNKATPDELLDLCIRTLGYPIVMENYVPWRMRVVA